MACGREDGAESTAFWNGSHDDVLPVATGMLPAVTQVIQARRQEEEEKSAKTLANHMVIWPRCVLR